jgi:SH3 domain protein
MLPINGAGFVYTSMSRTAPGSILREHMLRIVKEFDTTEQVNQRIDRMKSIFTTLMAMFLLAAIWSPAEIWAAKAYVSEPKEAFLRAGPGLNYKVLATIPTGTGLEILKTAEWIQVRSVASNGDVKDGWIPNSSVAAYPPESIFVKQLQTENAQLNEKLAGLEKERVDHAQREKDLLEKLKKLESAFEALKSGSTNYLKLKEEYDAVKSAQVSAEENIQALIQENEDLKFSARVKWFIAGAIVLFFGWILGSLTSRSQKKRKPYYSV